MMTDRECIARIEEIVNDYSTNTDDSKWADYFMERIVDVFIEYNRTNIFRQPFIN